VRPDSCFRFMQLDVAVCGRMPLVMGYPWDVYWLLGRAAEARHAVRLRRGHLLPLTFSPVIQAAPPSRSETTSASGRRRGGRRRGHRHVCRAAQSDRRAAEAARERQVERHHPGGSEAALRPGKYLKVKITNNSSRAIRSVYVWADVDRMRPHYEAVVVDTDPRMGRPSARGE
jgi:hypothetical protein